MTYSSNAAFKAQKNKIANYLRRGNKKHIKRLKYFTCYGTVTDGTTSKD